MLIQLTGKDIHPFQTIHPGGELADPSPVHFISDGSLRIYGSGSYYLQFKNWDALLAGEGERVPLELFSSGGALITGPHGAWDINVYDFDGEEMLYAGVMTSTSKPRAVWPDDNIRRRLYSFRKKGTRWVQGAEPLLKTDYIDDSWVGHNYGHQIVNEGNSCWLFYERVVREAKSAEGRRLPYLTEIFAREMLSPERVAEEEISILRVGSPAYPSTYRADWITGELSGFLVEGGRPVRVEIEGELFYMMGFSSGDFPTNRYGINVAWSRELIGGYRPLMEETPRGLNLIDFGKGIREKYGLSWGPGRPSFFRGPDQAWWVLFHAVKKEILPDRNYDQWPREPFEHFFRNCYLAPARFSLDDAGVPGVTIGD